MFHIKRQTLFRAIQPDEMGGLAIHGFVISPREVAHFRALDFDDAGAEIGELARGERNGDGLFQREDSDAL